MFIQFIQENLCSTHLQIQHMKLQKRPSGCWFQPFFPIAGGCGWGDDRYWRCVASRCLGIGCVKTYSRCLHSLQLRVCTCKVVLVGQSFPFGARPIFRGCFWWVSGKQLMDSIIKLPCFSSVRCSRLFLKISRETPNIPLERTPDESPNPPNEGNSFINCWGPRVCSRGILENSLQDGMGVKQVEPRRLFQTFLMFTRIHGEMIQFDEHIFHMGWFNHQTRNFYFHSEVTEQDGWLRRWTSPERQNVRQFRHQACWRKIHGISQWMFVENNATMKKNVGQFLPSIHLLCSKGEATKKKTPSQASWVFFGAGILIAFLDASKCLIEGALAAKELILFRE